MRFMKLTGYNYAWNSLMNLKYEDHACAITQKGNQVNLLKLDWKNLWNHIKWTYFWLVSGIWNHCVQAWCWQNWSTAASQTSRQKCLFVTDCPFVKLKTSCPCSYGAEERTVTAESLKICGCMMHGDPLKESVLLLLSNPLDRENTTY